MNPIAITYGIVGLVIIGLSLPLMKRKIKRNHWYGFRIPEAFKSEERWLEINQYGGRLMVRMGIVLAITGGVGLTLPQKYRIFYVFGSLAVILVGLGIVSTRMDRYAARTKKS